MVPIVVLVASLLNIKNICQQKDTYPIYCGYYVFAGLIIAEPKILGFARINQTKFSEEMIAKSGSQINIILNNYKKYFSYSYLFQTEI